MKTLNHDSRSCAKNPERERDELAGEGKEVFGRFVCDAGGAPSLGRSADYCRALTLGLEGRPQGSPLRRLPFAERRGGVLFEASPRLWVASELVDGG